MADFGVLLDVVGHPVLRTTALAFVVYFVWENRGKVNILWTEYQKELGRREERGE